MIWARGVNKYGAVFIISVRNQWAYVTEVSIRSLFLMVIMFVFAQLWSTTFHAIHRGTLAGYSVRTVVWYLVVTESMVMGSPRLVSQLSAEIKQGDIAYRLTKPISYVGYNYATFMGEALVRVAVNLVVGALVPLCFVGMPVLQWTSTVAFLAVCWLALSLQFTMNMCICLLLFWIEDGRGLELIFSRLVMILGGMMIPLPLFPGWLARICAWLPFQGIAYLPARTLVSPSGWLADGGSQLLLCLAWTVVFSGLCLWIYRRGVRQLHVQGG